MTNENINMRKIGFCMNVLMGVSLSFALSLIGILFSGHFTLSGWLISFAASTVLSLLIGFIIPVRKISTALIKKAGVKERSFAAHRLDSFISDIIYTPFITFAMVFIAYKNAVSHGAQFSFVPMYFHSLAISLLAGYVFIFILQPLYLKLLLKNKTTSVPESEK